MEGINKAKIIKPLILHKEDYVRLYKLNNKQGVLCIGKTAQVLIDFTLSNFETTSTIQLNPFLEERLIDKALIGVNYKTLKDFPKTNRVPNGHLLAENDLHELILNKQGNIVDYDKVTKELNVTQFFEGNIFYPAKEIKEEEPCIKDNPTYNLAELNQCKNKTCDKLFNYRRKKFELIKDDYNKMIGARFEDGYTMAFITNEDGNLIGILAEEDYYNMTPSGRLKFNRVKYPDALWVHSPEDTYHNVGIQIGIAFEDLERGEEYFLDNDKTLYLRDERGGSYQWYRIGKK